MSLFNKENKVFFSGEATTAEHIGTVHGAYTTGLKAAKDIIKNLSWLSNLIF